VGSTANAITRPEVTAGPMLRNRKPEYAPEPPGSGVGLGVGVAVGLAIAAGLPAGEATGVGVGSVGGCLCGRCADKFRASRLTKNAVSTRNTKPVNG